MATPSTERGFQVEALTGTIGAVVSGIDLAQPLSDSTMREIEHALHRHSVLFFPDQHLDDESHIRFGRWFGELDVHHSGRNLADHQEIHVLEGYGRDVDWHTDITYKELPARASVLRSVTVPDVGGDTIWASTAAAYEELSSAMQRFVDELSAYHDSCSTNSRDPHLEILGAVHPVVIDHPWSGRRCIFVNPMFTKHIVDLSPRESERVLALLFEQVQVPSHQVRWRWEPNTVAMWDNLATQHSVVVDYTAPRLMQRVTVRGPRPTSSRLPAASAPAMA
jgi:taurine dioxygenase